MKRFAVENLSHGDCAARIEGQLRERRIAFQISPEEGWVQVDACGPCADRRKQEGLPVEGCEKCVEMTRQIIADLGYTGILVED